MIHMVRRIILQLQFLTRIPVPLKVKFSDKEFAASFVYSPLVGLLLGGLLAGTYYLLSFFENRFMPVPLVILLEVILTGGLHIDGLADTFDGIFSNRPKDKILEIMKDSRIGTNGVLAIVFLLMFKAALLLSLDSDKIIFILLTMPVISRLAIPLSAGISNYARKEKGMAYSIVNETGWKEVTISFIITMMIVIPIGVYFKIPGIFIAVLFTLIFVMLFIKYVKNIIGGITGDIIGAVIELSELAFTGAFLITGLYFN